MNPNSRDLLDFQTTRYARKNYEKATFRRNTASNSIRVPAKPQSVLLLSTNPHESAVTWQVLRSEFDEMLLDNAKEKGVEVQRGIRVREVLFDGDTATGVVVQRANGTRETLNATVIADSTGSGH